MSTRPKDETTLTRIYVLKDPNTLNIRYVGKTVQELHIRLGEHIGESKRRKLHGTHKTNWINSLLNSNKIPFIELIDQCMWKDSKNLEIYYISKFLSEGCDLVNATDGGEGVLGRKVSQKTCNKISQKLREKLPKVYQYDLNGNLIKVWINAPEAAKELGFSSSGITRCLRQERFKYKGFIWKTELVKNANEEMLQAKEQRHLRNVQKSKGGYTQSILAKLCSQEAKLRDTPYYYVYDCNHNYLYEGISASDVGTFINNGLNRQDIDIASSITRCIKNNLLYYNKYYISLTPPIKDFTHTKHKALILIHYNDLCFYGIEEAANYFNVTRTNIINNIKRKTKTLNTKNFGKIVLTWSVNREHCRLYKKLYGLSTDEIEEISNIETTSS